MRPDMSRLSSRGRQSTAPLLRSLAFAVRNLPVNRKKGPLVRLAAKLARPPLAFTFYTRQLNLWWSASGFPDLLTRHMLFEGMYQQEVLVALTSLLRSGDTVIDCGGHHGLMAIVAARAVGTTGSVISFEPNPNSRRHFRENCTLNGIDNVRIESTALSHHAGSTKFYVQKGLVSWNSSMFEEFASQSGRDEIEEIQVPMTTLDQFLEFGPRPALIKIDAEGSEFLILLGALNILKKCRPILSMEFNPESAIAAGTTVKDMQVLLEGLGYRLIVLEADVAGYHTFERQVAFDPNKHCIGKLANVLCLPSDRS
jgi:FkbM family methyltransferase